MDSKVMNLLRQRKMESDYVIGYTEYELKKIGVLYDILIEGQLREFMLLEHLNSVLHPMPPYNQFPQR